MDDLALRSDRRYPVQYFLALTPPLFLRFAFKILLNRDPDPWSLFYYERQLAAGSLSRIEVLGHLRACPEGRDHSVTVSGLAWRFLLVRSVSRLQWGRRIVRWAWPADESYVAQPEPEQTGVNAFDFSLSSEQRERLGLPLGRPGIVAEPSVLSESGGENSQEALGREEDGRSRFPGEFPRRVFGTVCTRSHLAFARVLVKSVLDHHPEAAVVVCVADADASDCGFPKEVAVLDPTLLGIPNFEYLLLKYTASEVCCALKPFLAREVLATEGCAEFFYLDSDIKIFSPLVSMCELLEQHNIVVTPHALGPPTNPERFDQKPSFGDLLHSGVMNAGMFAFRNTEAVGCFLETWGEMVIGPGAFFVPGQVEQQSFNWCLAFVDQVGILRDPSYNVAYWNLHDRSLRWHPGENESWTVNGEPLVSFHYSGYDPEQPSLLSSWDSRHPTFVLSESIARVMEHYRLGVLEERRKEETQAGSAYSYAQFPSGLAIDSKMRAVFKEFEVHLSSGPSPWCAEGEDFYCRALTHPLPGSGSLMPSLFVTIYQDRADLHGQFPEANFHPFRFWAWVLNHGVVENGWEALFDRHRPSIADPVAATMALELYSSPGPSEEMSPCRSKRPFRPGREALFDGLEPGPLQRRLLEFGGEIYCGTVIGAIRSLYEEYPDLREKFPDALDHDALAFSEWLDAVKTDYGFPGGTADVFLSRARGRSLARVFSHVNCQHELAKHFPRAFVGDGLPDLVRLLAFDLRHGRQFDLEDLAMVLWAIQSGAWRGVGLCIELLSNQRLVPSSLTVEGQQKLFGPLLFSEGFAEELDRVREVLGAFEAEWNEDELAAWSEAPAGLSGVVDLRAEPAGSEMRPPPSRLRPKSAKLVPGVNLFGYFQSPIGLGSMTTGLGEALQFAGFPVQANVLGNVSMVDDLDPSVFVGAFNPSFDTNIFVSYPHFPEDMLARMPLQKVGGRRNIAYLAWEQEDVSPFWGDAFRGYDDVWALSDFAAKNLERGFGRRVDAVPCILDFDDFPIAQSKETYGLAPDKWTVLYVFNASSSTERKNPEAVLEAFEIAFGDREDVALVFKVSGFDNLEHSERARRFLDRVAASRADIRVLSDRMSREEILGLISAVDCYCSLHRAEGFGYTCAEAMAYGKAVVATGYSGNMHFMSKANSYPVSFSRVEVTRDEGPFLRGSLWAEPDVESAAEALLRAERGGEEHELLCQAAKRDVHAQLSAAAVGNLVRELLQRGQP